MANKINKNDASLERKIIKFTNKAEKLLDSNPELGVRYLKQAFRIYNKSNLPKEVYNKRISKVIIKYNNKINY